MRHIRGFSLIEMILAIVVMGIIAMTGSQILRAGVTAYTESQEAVETLSKAIYTLERLKKEIRATDYTSSYNVTTCTATRYQFTRTDGVTVDIQSAPPLLTMGYSTPAVTSTLTNQVQSFTFRYYQSNSALMGPPCSVANLAYVEVEYTLIDDTATYPRRMRIALRDKP